MLNSQSKKIVLRACVLNKYGYYKRRDIFAICNNMNEIGKTAWYIRKNKLNKNERAYFTFKEVLLA